MTTVLYFS